MRRKTPLPTMAERFPHLTGAWELDGPLTIDALEMTSVRYPTRWEGTDTLGRRVHVRYSFWRLAVEVEDRFALRMLLGEGDPGATEMTLSNAGLKQAVMRMGAPVMFPF